MSDAHAEIREDAIHGRCVIVAPKRGARPHDIPEAAEPPVHPKDCPFCDAKLAGNVVLSESLVQGNEVIRVIPNRFPALSRETPEAYGEQEVVLEARAHNMELADLPTEHVAEVLHMYAKRTNTLVQDAKLAYILIFKNRGGKAGATLQHPHSQIFAAGFVPPFVADRLQRMRVYRETHGSCYSCDLIAKEEHGPRHVRTDGMVLAFAPYVSAYPYEVWLLPRRHKDNIAQLSDAERFAFAESLKATLSVLNAHGMPYNYYLHQAIADPDEHFYIRLAPRTSVWGGVELASRVSINPVPPEDVPAFYRS